MYLNGLIYIFCYFEWNLEHAISKIIIFVKEINIKLVHMYLNVILTLYNYLIHSGRKKANLL